MLLRASIMIPAAFAMDYAIEKLSTGVRGAWRGGQEMAVGERAMDDSPSHPPPGSRALYRLNQVYDIISGHRGGAGEPEVVSVSRMLALVDKHLHAELVALMDAINRCSEGMAAGMGKSDAAESGGDCVARLRGFDCEVRESGVVGGGRGVFVSTPKPPPAQETSPSPGPSPSSPSTSELVESIASNQVDVDSKGVARDGVIKAGSIVCLFAGQAMSRWSLFKAEICSSLTSNYYKDNEYMMDRSSFDGSCVDGQTVTKRRTSLNDGSGSDASFSGSLVNHPSKGTETNATFYHSMLFLPHGTHVAMNESPSLSPSSPSSPSLSSPSLSSPPYQTPRCRECITLVLALRDLEPGEEVFTDYGLASDQGSRGDLPHWYEPVIYPQGSFETFTRSTAPEPSILGM